MPQGGNSSKNESSMGITFEAGITGREAFEYAATHDVVVVGGTDATVGLMVWAGAGGHGYLTSAYGMGADSFLEATLVTPAGEVMVANENQNSDLFWAIRGGGAGTWGAVVSVTVKAHAMPNTVMWALDVSARNGTSASEWYKVAAKIFSDLPRQREAGLSGYQTLSGAPLALTNAVFAYDTSRDEVEESALSLVKWLEARNSSIEVSSTFVTFPKWINMYHAFNLTQSVGGGSEGVTASRLLPAKTLTDVDSFAEFLESNGPTLEQSKVSITPARIRTIPTQAQDGFRSGRSISGSATALSVMVDNALNPAWRDTTVHFLVKESWPEYAPANIVKEGKDAMEQSAYELRELAPDSGAYINEVSFLATKGSFNKESNKVY